MIPLKSEKDLVLLREAGKILAGITQKVAASVKDGITTAELEKVAEKLFEKEGVESAFKGYHGYPASICTSAENIIVHGIPGNRKLKNGEIIGLDMGIKHKGFYSDLAVTVGVGKIDPQVKKLIDVTKQALTEGIKKAVPGNRLYDISWAIQNYVESNGFSVVREFVGHGIGQKLHEDPEIPNFGIPGTGPVLACGMVLAIEPMVNIGGWESVILSDGWTAITKDGSLSAHFEHSIAITKDGPEILTI